MLVPHLLKIYFGLGWPSSVLEIVSSQRLKTNWSMIKVLWSRIYDQWSMIKDLWSRIYNQGSMVKDQGSRIKDHGSRIKYQLDLMLSVQVTRKDQRIHELEEQVRILSRHATPVGTPTSIQTKSFPTSPPARNSMVNTLSEYTFHLNSEPSESTQQLEESSA